jgi:hypothetical protein
MHKASLGLQSFSSQPKTKHNALHRLTILSDLPQHIRNRYMPLGSRDLKNTRLLVVSGVPTNAKKGLQLSEHTAFGPNFVFKVR